MHQLMHPSYLSARRQIIRVLAAAAVPALLLGALAVTPAAASSGPACGTLTADTVLTSDLHCDLTIGASGITLDLAGHTLFGSVTIQGEGASINGTTIRNGTIADSAVGIWMEETKDTTISHVRLINDSAGLSGMFQGAIVARIASDGLRVEHCLISTSGRAIFTQGGDNTFTGDGFHSGGLTDSAGHPVMDGLHVNVQAGSDIVISGNHTRHNAAYGIRAEPGTVVDGGGNTSVGNPDGCLGVTCS